MLFENVLIEAVGKINGYISLFLIIDDNPERILTDIYSGESENLLTRVIESSKELTGEDLEPHDLQDELYKRLIPYLNTLIKGVEFVYDSDKYPAPIQVFEGEREIGRINIFEKIYTVIPHKDIQREEQELLQLEKEFQKNAEEIKRYEDYQSNPLAYGESAVEKMKIALRKTHYEKKIKSKYQELVELSMELEQSIITQKVRLEKTVEGLKPYENMQYDIANQFKNNYQYEITREEYY